MQAKEVSCDRGKEGADTASWPLGLAVPPGTDSNAGPRVGWPDWLPPPFYLTLGCLVNRAPLEVEMEPGQGSGRDGESSDNTVDQVRIESGTKLWSPYIGLHGRGKDKKLLDFPSACGTEAAAFTSLAEKVSHRECDGKKTKMFPGRKEALWLHVVYHIVIKHDI